MGLRDLITGTRADPIPEDGMGQSLFTELLWAKRFRGLRRREVVWSDPSEADKSAWQEHPDISRFGDFLVGVAHVAQRRCWIVERIWNGWPDPPEFAFFAMEAGGEVWAAADFDRWPAPWRKPPVLREQSA
ncbi:MAG: hypothetical protein AAGE80_15980 [Pseudomonadota bacterium]